MTLCKQTADFFCQQTAETEIFSILIGLKIGIDAYIVIFFGLKELTSMRPSRISHDASDPDGINVTILSMSFPIIEDGLVMERFVRLIIHSRNGCLHFNFVIFVSSIANRSSFSFDDVKPISDGGGFVSSSRQRDSFRPISQSVALTSRLDARLPW